MKSTTTLLSCLLCLCLFQACSDPNYNGDQYQAFDSMDELTQEIVESIKTKNSNQLLKLLNNQMLVRDLLIASKSKNAQKIKAYMNSPKGRQDLSVKHLAQKQRLSAFFSTALPKQLADQASTLRSTGIELTQQKAYEEGSPAQMQSYSLRLTDGTNKNYTYDIQVIYWNGYYHLVEVAGFLNSL